MERMEIHSQEEYEANKDFDGILVIKCRGLVLRENASAVLWENASAVLRENASAELRGNARAELRENARAELRENASAVLRENASADAFDNSAALMFGDNAVRCFANATKKQWVEPSYDRSILDIIPEREGGKLVLYKCVNPETQCDFHSGKINYKQGEVVECPDWDPDPERQCGGGLHLCLSAAATRNFNQGLILKCLVDPDDVVIFPGNVEKVRCRRVLPVATVDSFGRILPRQAAQSKPGGKK